MNKIILMGRLTRDPDIKVTETVNPVTIARFSIAVDRKFTKGDEKETDFFNVTAFGKLAEFCDRYLKQGTKILMTGRVQNDNYTKQTGEKVYSVGIIAEEIEFAESKNAQSNNSEAQTESKPDANGFMNIPDNIDEELPFN